MAVICGPMSFITVMSTPLVLGIIASLFIYLLIIIDYE